MKRWCLFYECVQCTLNNETRKTNAHKVCDRQKDDKRQRRRVLRKTLPFQVVKFTDKFYIEVIVLTWHQGVVPLARRCVLGPWGKLGYWGLPPDAPGRYWCVINWEYAYKCVPTMRYVFWPRNSSSKYENAAVQCLL